MTTRFVVLGSDEEDEDEDILLREEEGHKGYAELEHEPNIGLTTPPNQIAPQSTAASGSDICMTGPEPPMSMQSPGTNISKSTVQAATTQYSSVSNEKVPASLPSSEAIRLELASVHDALLTDWNKSSSATLNVSHAPEGGGGSADHPSNLPSPVPTTAKGKAIPKRGLTTYGRLEEAREPKDKTLPEEMEKDVWEFNLQSQGSGVTTVAVTKGNAKNSTSSLKSSRSIRQTSVGENGWGVYVIPDEEDDEDWTGKESLKGRKKVAPRKSVTNKRSKTSMTFPTDGAIADIVPLVYGDDENDDDYSPAGKSRKAKKKITIDPPISSGRKKTRSNTDDWELMPALPKGRKSAVLKQLAAGFEFDRDSVTLKAPTDLETEARACASTQSLHNDNPTLSPFKVDLARDSLVLPEEEKEKYHIFSSIVTSPDGTSLLPEGSEELPVVESPQLPSGPQGLLESLAVGTGIYISPTIPDEEYLGLKYKSGNETSTRDGKESESIPISSDASKTGKRKSKLGSRNRTLAEMLDVETDKDEGHSNEEIVNMGMPKDNNGQSPVAKRVRLKQARSKTSMAIYNSPHENKSVPHNNATMPTSPTGLQKIPQKLTIVAGSDDDSPLSELDEGAVMSVKRTFDNYVPSQPTKSYNQINIRQESDPTPEISVPSKPKQPVPKASDRKRSGRNTSKNISLDEDTTHDEENHLSGAKSEAQPKSRKPLVKRRRKSQVDLEADVDEQPPKPSAFTLADMASDEEHSNDLDFMLPPKRKASKTGRAETKHGKSNKKIKNSEGSAKDLDEQGLVMKAKDAVGSELDENGVGGSSELRSLTSKEHSIGAGREMTPPPAPVSREPVLTPKQPETPQRTEPAVKKNPHSPINGGKPPAVKFRVGLSRRANIEPLHGYLKR